MQHRDADQYLEYEKDLVAAVRDVVSELRLIELADFLYYVRSNNTGPIDALVESAVELYFDPESLRYGKSASVAVSWDGDMKVSLDFEFKHKDLNIYFTIFLMRYEAAIQINYMSFSREANNQSQDFRVAQTRAYLADARRRLADSRLAWWKPSAFCLTSVS